MTDATKEPLARLLRLQILVSTLGGVAHAGWWRTEFLTPAGLRYLDRVFPRTRYAAAVRSTAVAARKVHDSSIGRGGAYHLFRLPEPSETQLRTLAVGGQVDQVVEDLVPILENREALLTRIDGLAGDIGHVQEPEPGPQAIGSARDLRRGGLTEKWAGAYLHAFRTGFRVFPYLEVERIL